MIPSPSTQEQWKFFRFGLIVTGRGEQKFLTHLFRCLTSTRQCAFEVIQRVEQLSPVTSPKRTIKMVGVARSLPSRDEDIGLIARAYLSQDDRYVILVDDLEGSRSNDAEEVYQRYRLALDTMLGSDRGRASVHFLRNMLEAYYFADAAAVNRVLGENTLAHDHSGDVETIKHPKNDMRNVFIGFHEVKHGEQIVKNLNVPHVLSRPETCSALRTLFAWCVRAIGQPFSNDYQLDQGTYFVVTGRQLDNF